MSIVEISANVIFYGLMLVLALFSLTMIYVLLRFGRSKTLGLILAILYFILMSSLYAAAQSNFNNLPFL